MSELLHNDEKRVEYIELIYDLIFVYAVFGVIVRHWKTAEKRGK